MRLQLVKLGGGLIAPKSWKPKTADVKTIRRLGEEIKRYWLKIADKDLGLIIGHGGGNFPHTEAVKYLPHKGFKVSERKKALGVCLTQLAAAELNRIVWKEFLELGLPVSTIAPHDIWLSNNKNSGALDVVGMLLGWRMIPLVYGDVIWDKKRGCTIFSTERCLAHLAEGLSGLGMRMERIIQVSQEDGVLDDKGRLIERINQQNFSQLKRFIVGAKGVDVTGGMLHKVKESLRLAEKLGIETLVINGGRFGVLVRALSGEQVVGTKIG